VVFGMPQAAHRLGAAEALLPLSAIPAVITELCARREPGGRPGPRVAPASPRWRSKEDE
jgi:hypothetical protein